MKKEEFDQKMSSMLEKIGNDNSNLILDDVAVFIDNNIKMNEEIEKKNNEIKELQKRNETLQRVNGNLLQQVGNIDQTTNENRNVKNVADEGKPVFNMRDVFDKNGNFKFNL